MENTLIKLKLVKLLAQTVKPPYQGLACSDGLDFKVLAGNFYTVENLGLPISYFGQNWIQFAKADALDKCEPIKTDIDDMPTKTWAYTGNQWSITLDIKSLEWACRAVSFHDVRQYFNSLLIYQNGGLCGTDGYRMHLVNPDYSYNQVCALIPHTELALAIKAAKIQKLDTIGLICWDRTDNSVPLFKIQCGDFVIDGLQMDSSYPDWRRVVPDCEALGFAIPIDNPKSLCEEIAKTERLAKALNPEKDAMKLAWAEVNGSIALHAKEPSTTENQILDARYIKDAITGFDSATYYKNTDRLKQSILELSENQFAVLMPIRGKEDMPKKA